MLTMLIIIEQYVSRLNSVLLAKIDDNFSLQIGHFERQGIGKRLLDCLNTWSALYLGYCYI